MNNLDKTYTSLLQDILDNGVEKKDRTGTGTISVFGRQIRHKMSEGFPLLTTKKMYMKGVITELLWFLRGDTNIQILVQNNCHIWDGDAYKNYLKNRDSFSNRDNVKEDVVINGINGSSNRAYTMEEFINTIRTNNVFAERWGELGPVYGKQWRSWRGIDINKSKDGTPFGYKPKQIDQIANLINDLKTNPDSRRLMVNAWNVGELDQMTLPPCHYGFQVYTRELSHDERLPKKIKLTGHGGEIEFSLTDKREIKYYGKTKESNESLERVEKIKDNEVFYQTEFGWGVFLDTNTFETVSYDGTEWGGHKLNIPTRAISLMWNQRSVDTFLGLPFNIASYGLLLEIIAKEVNMVPDELIGNLGDVHLYSNHIEQAKEQIGRELTLEERYNLIEEDKHTQFVNWQSLGTDRVKEVLDKQNIPTRTREPHPLPTLKINTEFWQTESGECGVGPLKTNLQGFEISDFVIENYQSHPTIKAPLSN